LVKKKALGEYADKLTLHGDPKFGPAAASSVGASLVRPGNSSFALGVFSRGCIESNRKMS
jgi:hypothetical protein